jgi:hypothetical protein
MITIYEGKPIALCDGCNLATLNLRNKVTASIELLRRGWRINEFSYAWQHFCPECAHEFAADEPVRT